MMHSIQSATSDWDAVVIGAGPAGSVSALLLARAGVRTLLIDAKTFPRAKVCGGCISRRTLEALDLLCLKSRVEACGSKPTHSVQIVHCGRALNFLIPPGLAVTRSSLDAALVSAAVAAGACFRDETTGKVLSTCQDSRRHITLKTRKASADHIRTKVVLACDGLGNPSLAQLPEFCCRTTPNSRVGVGTVISAKGWDIESGVIHLAVGEGGYVGIVRTEEDTLSIAGAVDRALLQQFPPVFAINSIWRESQAPWKKLPQTLKFVGTRPLSQRASRFAAERLFVVGDAAGYVEPFTGEGMAIAIESAISVAPLAVAACQNWRPELESAWAAQLPRVAWHRQQVMQGLAWLLRRPKLLESGLALMSHFPWVASLMAEGINSPSVSARKSV